MYSVWALSAPCCSTVYTTTFFYRSEANKRGGRKENERKRRSNEVVNIYWKWEKKRGGSGSGEKEEGRGNLIPCEMRTPRLLLLLSLSSFLLRPSLRLARICSRQISCAGKAASTAVVVVYTPRRREGRGQATFTRKLCFGGRRPGNKLRRWRRRRRRGQISAHG